MTSIDVGQIERKTQNRIVEMFKNGLGFEYLGNWEDRRDNRNIEEIYLRRFLQKRGYAAQLADKAVFELTKAASIQNKTLYDANREVYSLLRYGAKVKTGFQENAATVEFIDWENPEENYFGIAEEVIVIGQNNKRPDIVLYVNGIAVGVLELKRSRISIGEGIRQNLDNQKEMFIRHFFTTVQLVMAGNDTEGLRYATTETPEKYYLTWKESAGGENKLDAHLAQVCNKKRLLELIHDFIVFDSGVKKIARHNQYFAVKAAQPFINREEGGIIWHTQGSGKSLIMIWLAKWIREHIKDARVLIITDREELDEQIENFFMGVNERIYRTKSGRDLINNLNSHLPWLLCSLIHKFRGNTEGDFEAYLRDINDSLPSGFEAKGNIFVFVDECHRTQSGDLHDAMEAILPRAVFIGFTGTPLLKKDKKRSIEVFGRYIHTYKYDEAVADGVVLDLQYEAKDIDQFLLSKDRVDQWFEAKTRGLNDFAKTALKRKWGTMQKVYSSESRLGRIVDDILLDMDIKDRLVSGRGNAMLVAGSIYEACKYYELFQKRGLKSCAIVTSYSADVSEVKGETTDFEEETERAEEYDTYRRMKAYYESVYPDIKTRGFDTVIKEKFVKDPGQMKLLIVVDKLLTGFDAPPATYLYIDKSMQDHGLFQAVCRVNRLDTEDKRYGYIVDYKDLFKSLKEAVHDYTSEAFDGYDKEDVEGLLKERLKSGRKNLSEARETVAKLLEPVQPPKGLHEYVVYFCGDTEKHEDLERTAPRRTALYKAASSFLRSYASIANEMELAGYTKTDVEHIKGEVERANSIRGDIQIASGDYIDLKAFEPAMRHLIDSYIDARESKTVSGFQDVTLVDTIVRKGVGALAELPPEMGENDEVAAEAIENNVRKVIIQKKPTNPAFFEKMSELLDKLIKERRAGARAYANYLKEMVDLVKKVMGTAGADSYPLSVNTGAKRSLYDNLKQNEALALAINSEIVKSKKDAWRGNLIKEKEVRIAIKKVLGGFGIVDDTIIEAIFQLAKNQGDY